MPGLIMPEQRFRDDDGAAEPLLAAALAAYAAGQESEHAVLTALARARLLVPVLATATATAPATGTGTGTEEAGTTAGRGLRREKTSDMAVPTLTGRDGRRALVAFTSVAALGRWRKDARPMPAGADQVCQAALAEAAHAVIVDVAGPVPLAVEGARLAALAAGRPVPWPAEDPDVRAAVDAVVAADPCVAGARLANGAGGTDLTVRLVLAAGPAAAAHPASGRPAVAQPAVAQPAVAQPEAAARRAAAAIMGALAGRFRRGIEIAVVPGPRG